MSVVISDTLSRDLLWWLQNTAVPCVTVGERYDQWGQNKKPMMEIARDSMIEELSQAIKQKEEELSINLFEGMDLDRTYSDQLNELIEKAAKK